MKGKNISININDELEKLDFMKRKALQEQIQRFKCLESLSIPTNFLLTVDNQIILSENNLIYGAGNFSYDKVSMLLQNGFLGNLFNGKTNDKVNPYCASFLAIPESISLRDFNSNFDRSDYFPFGPLGSNWGSYCLAFIVLKSDSKLFDFDLYRYGEASSLTRSFADVRKISVQRYNGVSSILYGVPSNMTLGIILGDDLFREINIVQFITNLFPNCYITTKDGRVIYSPKIDKNDFDSVILRVQDYNSITDKYRRKVNRKRW